MKHFHTKMWLKRVHTSNYFNLLGAGITCVIDIYNLRRVSFFNSFRCPSFSFLKKCSSYPKYKIIYKSMHTAVRKCIYINLSLPPIHCNTLLTTINYHIKIIVQKIAVKWRNFWFQSLGGPVNVGTEWWALSPTCHTYYHVIAIQIFSSNINMYDLSKIS